MDGAAKILALDNGDVASLAPESEMAAPFPQLHHMDDVLTAPAGCVLRQRKVLSASEISATKTYRMIGLAGTA